MKSLCFICKITLLTASTLTFPPRYVTQTVCWLLNSINLSSRSISDYCLTALNRGLSFAPTVHCQEFDVHVDIHSFFWNLKGSMGTKTCMA